MKKTLEQKSPWKLISKEKILDTPIFDISLEKAVCPRNGKTGGFYVFNIPDWVNIVALTGNNEIVMIRQFRHGTKTYEYEIPGGLIDPEDKSPAEAGMRELFEETGYTGDSPVIIGSVHPNPALQNNLCHTVFTKNARQISHPAMEDSEDIETLLIPVEQVWKMINHGEIRHGLVLNALHFFLNLKIRGEV